MPGAKFPDALLVVPEFPPSKDIIQAQDLQTNGTKGLVIGLVQRIMFLIETFWWINQLEFQGGTHSLIVCWLFISHSAFWSPRLYNSHPSSPLPLFPSSPLPLFHSSPLPLFPSSPLVTSRRFFVLCLFGYKSYIRPFLTTVFTSGINFLIMLFE